jgi:uncharacterized protein with HEPN domain
MRDRAAEAIALAAGRTRADPDHDRMLELSLTRLVEVVGEAANRIPRDEQSRFSGLPWPMMIGMRNRLIHGYDSVDLDILWETVRDHLPPLVEQLDALLD